MRTNVVAVHHLLGAAEIAELLGVSRRRVNQLASEPGFPEPEVVLSAGKVWKREAIEGWAERTGRLT